MHILRSKLLPDWEQIVANIESWAEKKDDAAFPNTWNPPIWYTNHADAQLGYGWIIICKNKEWECFIDYKDIHVTIIRNDDKIVHGLNSSQYSHVGEIEMTYFSDNEADLQDFLNDFFPGETYENDVAVQQWG